MVTRTTLTDALIEAGLEAEAAQRAARMIEEEQGAAARQSDVDERFNRVDDGLDRLGDGLAAQDRLNEARFNGVDKEIKAVNSRISDLRAELTGRFTDLKEGMEQRFTEHKESMERGLAALKESLEAKIDSEVALLRGEMTALKEGLEAKIDSEVSLLRGEMAALKESFEAKIDSEIASLRREQRIFMWVAGIGFTGAVATVVGLLIELLSRTS